MILERELDAAESSLLDSLASVPRVYASSDDIHIRDYIGVLKSNSKKYETVNHDLASRKKQNGNVLESDQLIKTRLNIVHRDTYDAVKLLNSRLIALDQDTCSSIGAQSLHGDRDEVCRDNVSKVDEPTAGA